MTTGLVLVALSMASVIFVGISTPLWVILVAFFIFGFGTGNVIAPASTVMQNVLPLARAGAGSAVQNTVRQVGGALGVAIIGTVLATQYSSRVDGAIGQLPPQIPDAAREAARESIVATDAVLDAAAAQGAPSGLLDSIRQAAYDAFLTSSHVTYLTSMVLVAVAAIVVVTLLPRINPPRKDSPVQPDSPIDDRVAIQDAVYPEEATAEEGTARPPA